MFLNRSPNQHKNGSWFHLGKYTPLILVIVMVIIAEILYYFVSHLDVHAPPRFSVTPEDIVYVNLGKYFSFAMHNINVFSTISFFYIYFVCHFQLAFSIILFMEICKKKIKSCSQWFLFQLYEALNSNT